MQGFSKVLINRHKHLAVITVALLSIITVDSLGYTPDSCHLSPIIL